mmetsp:Transcript_39120/g.112462  ORF Transcript_39120/g.112462 Transcript_39120/m.112462 type:complete len:1261 (-) Transcript_39120:40-3822(-)
MADVCSAEPEHVCCLAWAITKANRETISAKQLRALHEEVRALTEFVGAQVLEVNATHGVLRDGGAVGTKVPSGVMMSRADMLVRLGQLVCRWCSQQEPEVFVRVGVHIGELHWIVLPHVEQKGFFGKSVSIARHLAETAPKDNVVHLLPVAKQMLSVFERLTFVVCSNLVPTNGHTSYVLDTWEEAKDDSGTPGTDTVSAVRPAAIRSHITITPKVPQGSLSKQVMGMTEDSFAKFLQSYGVDPAMFGRGQAKTLSSFLKEMTEERGSYLFQVENKLERKLEIVRLTLVASGPSGKDYNLMLESDVLEDGRQRMRNQKLACVVPEAQSWQEAVKQKFQTIFGLNEELQRGLLSVEADGIKTERTTSPSIPGIPTTYLTHEVRMRVLDTKREGLECMGLPGMKEFTSKDAEGRALHKWKWTLVGEQNNTTDSLRELLSDYHINIEEFDEGALTDLVEEVYETRISTLTVRNKELTRNLQIIKVWITADILSVPHVLVHKYKRKGGKLDGSVANRPISMRLKCSERWNTALTQALSKRLGVDPKAIGKAIQVDEGSYRLCEEVEYSRSFPGLKTIYRIHEVTCRAKSSCTQLGLPNGHDFEHVRREDNTDTSTAFTWKSRKDIFGSRLVFRRSLLDDSEIEDPNKLDPKRRIPAPSPVSPPSRRRVSTLAFGGVSSTLVEDLMAGKSCDLTRARNAARRIRDKDYSCQMFFEDCKASFPELALYMGVAGEDGTPTTTSSGRSADDEYQRTIGALFAVYWLMRLNTDGAQSFCFGVGNDWKPLSKTSRSPKRSEEELAKRTNFLSQVDWSLFDDVLKAAGLLLNKKDAKGDLVHDEERVLAMLVLTAIHDIMKVEALCPTVAGRREFSGYKTGESITDHDIALGYILENHPNALPSYAGLPQKSRDSVKFTQCNMEYNMGWLVQAEAPPGALFKKFREIIKAGQADPQDVAFYFTHWLTDLAGAEPCPQEGAEKFVLKFPMKVLSSFLRSFSFVQYLSHKTETQVYEDYLDWRWKMHEPSLGQAPIERGSIAKLRLVVMAQGSSDIWLEAYNSLGSDHRLILDSEMACTGIEGQKYDRDEGGLNGGPAFLLYYGPALLQKNASDARGALEVLAEVFRNARALWPADDRFAGETVTVMLDSLKEQTVQGMQQLGPGDIWVVQRNTAKSAQVRKLSMLKDGSSDSLDWGSLRVLNIGSSTQTSQLFQEDVVVGAPAFVKMAELDPPDVQEHGGCFVSCSWTGCWSAKPEPKLDSAEVAPRYRCCR